MSSSPTLQPVRKEFDGTLWTLIFQRFLPHPVEAVWSSLSDPAALATWSPFEASRNLSETGSVTLTMTDGPEPVDIPSEVIVAEAPHVLEYTWAGDLLRWELSAEKGGTLLTLKHTVQDKDWLAKVAAGWHICLEVAAKRLDGQDAPRIVGYEAMNHGWGELHEAYAEQLGVPATPLPQETGDAGS